MQKIVLLHDRLSTILRDVTCSPLVGYLIKESAPVVRFRRPLQQRLLSKVLSFKTRPSASLPGNPLASWISSLVKPSSSISLHLLVIKDRHIAPRCPTSAVFAHGRHSPPFYHSLAWLCLIIQMVRSLRGSVGAAGRCVLVIVDHRDRRFAEGLYPSLEVFPRSGWRDWRAYAFV